MAACVVASRRVLDQAESYYTRTGDECRGFLSEEHGFLPRKRAEPSLPESHRAWDEIAAALPALWRDVGVRAAVDSLPRLSATEEDLPDRYLRRATTILSMLAHSYTYSELGDKRPLPPMLEDPWREATSRLGRSEPYMQYEDLILGNWRLSEPDAPIRLEYLQLLVETLGIETERRFYLTQVEIHARATPIVGAVVRAQEALVAGDDDAVENELLGMIDVVRAVYDEVFLKVDPNPYSDTPVDPVLWGALVAPFAVSFKEHVPGPGGTAAPLFHVLDAFLGRGVYESSFGHEATRLREWGPRTIGEFVTAITEGPGARTILSDGPRRLRGLVQTLAEVYAGERGLLQAHRIKAYGFLETAFKVGRPVTIGGFGGTFHDRPWRTVHGELNESREERQLGRPFHSLRCVLADRRPVGSAGAKLLTLDVAEEGVVYRPGDQCFVLPTNSDEQVERVMRALRAAGDEPVALQPHWRLALRPYLGADVPTALPLAEFLRYAALRPLARSVARRLLALSSSRALLEVIEAREEDQWELWDILELLSEDGWDVTTLWRSPDPGESFAGFLLPMRPRQYAIASPGGNGRPAKEIQLLVEPLEYTSERRGRPGVPRLGTASEYLDEVAPIGAEMPIEIVRPPRFRLPPDETAPIVMFADRAGVATFRSFLRARAAIAPRAETVLFLETADGDIYFGDELAGFQNEGWLTVWSGADADEAAIRRLLGSGYAYVGGRDGFVQRVLVWLERLEGASSVRRLLARNRIMLHVSPTLAPIGTGSVGGDLYDASGLVLHNDEEHGYWLAMEGAVYDMTEFRHRHPGGYHIVDGSAGMDAYSEYSAVYHFRDPAINAMLEMYRIGRIRRLRLEEPALHDLYRSWIRTLYIVVEMQNAFENDVRYLDVATTCVEPPEALTPLKLMMFANTQGRFVELYCKGIVDPLDGLWRQSIEVTRAGEEPAGLRRELERAMSQELFDRVGGALRQQWVDARMGDDVSWTAAAARISTVSACDRGLLVSVKEALRDGIRVFERFEGEAAGQGESLLAALRRIPGFFASYQSSLRDAID
jgi:indoleamine 2,3-dioxygenase/cytochrome b5-like protein